MTILDERLEEKRFKGENENTSVISKTANNMAPLSLKGVSPLFLMDDVSLYFNNDRHSLLFLWKKITYHLYT